MVYYKLLRVILTRKAARPVFPTAESIQDASALQVLFGERQNADICPA